MNRYKFSEGIIIGVVLTLLIGVALYLRVYLPYESVFGGEWIKFTGVDGYYHMRLVDNLLNHFPQHITFDPYTFYPHGRIVDWPPFFDWLLTGTIWLVSLGTPSQQTIDVVGVYFPAILGAITLIPVYFIGKELFNRWVGVLSAGLVAMLPCGFLSRSILGFTDHHVAETLFTTVTILFLILAIKSAKRKQVTFSHLKCRNWAIIGKPLICSLLAGIFLGIYLLTWVGGLLFVFVIFTYFVIQSIIDHMRDENDDYLAIISTLFMLVALIISLPLLPQAAWLSHLYLPSFIIATLTPLALTGISHLLKSRRIKPIYYPLALIGLGLTGLAIFYIVNPALLEAMLDRFRTFTPSAFSLTIIEAQPLLFPTGDFSFALAWSNFRTGFFLSFVALGVLIYLIVKHGSADKNLLVVWSLLILAATLGQRRFGYYYAVNVALLTAYLAVLAYLAIQFVIDYLRGKHTDYHRRQILQFAGFKEAAVEPMEIPKKLKKKKAKSKKHAAGIPINYISATIGVLAIFFLTFFPNISPAIAITKTPRFAPSDAWCETLSWLKENTPDPFGNPDAYYELYELPPKGKDYDYPESAYGVMSWWDYGHWITRIAHRIPVSNPFQNNVGIVARFFTAQDEISANEIMHNMNSRYVVIDDSTALSKFHAVATLAGDSREDYFERYYIRQEGRLEQVTLFYPKYYQSLAVRLYNFDGAEVIAEKPIVISYEQKIEQDGNLYMEITGSWVFSSYEEAEAYVSSRQSENYRIVSQNPFISPVPLVELQHYDLIYESTYEVMQPEIGMIPAVKIFEYVR